MRTAVAATALGITLIAAAGLGGCAPHVPAQPPPDPMPSRTPVFASDEEALAAAEEAYAAYLDVANAVAQDGGVNPERYKEVTTHDWLAQETASAEELQRSGHRQVGDLALLSMTLQQAESEGADAMVTAYACLDISGTAFVDANGIDVTPPGRMPIAALEVVFTTLKVGLEGGPAVRDHVRLLIDGSDLWTGQDFC